MATTNKIKRMNFNKIIINFLYPAVCNLLVIKEEKENWIKFSSDKIELNVFYNKYEKMYYVNIGYIDDLMYPLDLYTGINTSNIKLFINDLIIFFNSPKGKKILEGYLSPLIQTVEEKSKEYTLSIIINQNIKKINVAWAEKNYKLFIDLIENCNIEKLPSSLLLKYKFAKNKLKD